MAAFEGTCDCCIVGSGLAGLSTAWTLIENNGRDPSSIILLEARERVGGRTLTVKNDDDSTVDVGGQWVGETQRRVLSFINRFGLELKDQYYPPSPIGANNTNNQPLDYLVECVGYCNPPLEEEAIKEFKRFISVLDTLIEEIDPQAPWKHPRAEEFDKMSILDYTKSQLQTQSARKEALLLAEAVTAVESQNVSFLYYLFFVKSGGGIVSLGDGEQGAQKWYIKGGSQQISKLMMKHLEEKGVRFHFSDAVKSLEKLVDGLTRVTTRSGTVVNAKECVIAMSPNLALKHINFSPPLPSEQKEFYQSISHGQAAKVIVSFEKAFWLTNHVTEGIAQSHFADTGPVQNIFHTEVGENPGLVCLCVGAPATTLLGKTPLERKKMILSQLMKIYFPSKQATDLNDMEEILGLKTYIDKLWAEEEFSGGCYCGMWAPDGNFSKHGEKYLPRLGRKVKSGAWNQQLHFASTEISDSFVAYMEGALRSGEIAGSMVHENLR